ncbi:glycosyltransferase family 8 protein [Vreelandella utahensis]|uniref:glycosyltransferase family 8 protein n=1 Tax=Vreelandella halophila TaxID=86177 RepID=UPI0009850B30|nr:glycosyltransferase family 8 protein [Halomonas utahensis]
MDDTLHIAACCDDNYAPYAGVMMLSALKATPDTAIHFHLVDCGITRDNLQALKNTVEGAGGTLNVIEPDDSLYRDLPTHRYGPAVYQRISLPAYLPETVTRVLYLDCDTLVLGNLNHLWETNLEGYPVAAVENYSPTACRDIGLPRPEYFNSGVLLMDLAVWRDEALHRAVDDYAREHAAGLTFVDQCSLNAVLRQRWRRLPARWNQQSDIYKVMTRDNDGCGYAPQELHEAFVNPGIVHFIGAKKPWKRYSFHPLKDTYRAVLAQTPWAGMTPPDDSPGTRFRYVTALGRHWNTYRRKAQIKKAARHGP